MTRDNSDATVDAVDDAQTRGSARPLSRRVRMIVSLLLAAGITAVIVGFMKAETTTGTDRLPDAIEDIVPVAGAIQQPQQTQVFIDLASGYEAELSVDGVPIPIIDIGEVGRIEERPGEQLELPPAAIFEPGNATLTYTPGADAPIESFEPGRHEVTVIYWNSVEGRDSARTYRWTFEVV